MIRTGHLARYYDGIVTDTSDPKPGPARVVFAVVP